MKNRRYEKPEVMFELIMREVVNYRMLSFKTSFSQRDKMKKTVISIILNLMEFGEMVNSNIEETDFYAALIPDYYSVEAYKSYANWTPGDNNDRVKNTQIEIRINILLSLLGIIYEQHMFNKNGKKFLALCHNNSRVTGT